MHFLLTLLVYLAFTLTADAGILRADHPANSVECARRMAEGEVRRLAMVVGNDTIRNSRLVNASRDATLVAAVLREIGFDVSVHLELDRPQLRAALRAFRGRIGSLCDHDIVVFYYAGNGFELGRMSYIATVDVAYPDKLETELSTLREWVRLAEIVENLSEHRGAKIIIVDTCRNYSLASSRAADTPEFAASFQPPRNSLIAYAAEPGQYAMDGPAGGNGPYAAALARNLSKTRASIEEILRRVRSEVEQQTGGQQLPFMESGLLQTIVLKTDAASTGTRSLAEASRKSASGSSTTPKQSAEKRLALVVGNGNYLHAGPLPNTHNDAADVAAALRRLGFLVTEMLDADQNKMRNALSAFDERVEQEAPDWALIYYAGHGIARDETPYMVPIDAKLTSHTVIDQQAVAVMPVLGTVSKARRIGVVILDACRDNPFLEQMKIGARKRNIILTKGLPAVEPSDENVLVAYATKHGLVASDGEDGRRNSPYVEALLEILEQPGIELDMLFRIVRQSVRRRTNNEQLPFTYASLPPEPIYFTPPR